MSGDNATGNTSMTIKGHALTGSGALRRCATLTRSGDYRDDGLGQTRVRMGGVAITAGITLATKVADGLKKAAQAGRVNIDSMGLGVSPVTLEYQGHNDCCLIFSPCWRRHRKANNRTVGQNMVLTMSLALPFKSR